MKLKLKDFRDQGNKCGYILMESLTEESAKQIVSGINVDDDDCELDVEIKINGVLVDAKVMLEHLYDSVEINAKNIAKKMVNESVSERVSEIIDRLYSIESKVDEVNNQIDWDDVYNGVMLKS